VIETIKKILRAVRGLIREAHFLAVELALFLGLLIFLWNEIAARLH
jgi:hypothetical protein